MNDRTLDYLMSKRDSRRDSRRGSDSRDREDGARRDSRDYRHGEGHGNVDFEGSMDFENSKRYSSEDDERYDSRDFRDRRDYHDTPRLSKTDIHRWKQMMENEDGSRGAHYDMQQIMSVADKHGVKFDEYSEKEFCIAVNMMYSDYCKVAKKYVSPDKELAFFADLAKAFLDDEDGPEPSEKLALYFHCIVDA